MKTIELKSRRRTNSKEFNALIYAYILKNICDPDDSTALKSDTEKLVYLKKTFHSEYCYPLHLSRYGSVQEVLRQWLMGLPSAINIAFENWEILEIAVRWQSIPKDYSEAEAYKILDNWFKLLAFKIMQLWKIHKIN